MAGFLVGIGKAGEVAERSPAVISANLKEDMLLHKKRLVLDRSARNLVHQIKIDQKVVYKNFQSRLVRSKLAFARLMGQKDIEKDLRAKNLGGLNTDIVGAADEEYTFLSKLQQRPCTASSFSPRIPVPTKDKPKKQGASGKAESNVKRKAGSNVIRNPNIQPKAELAGQIERPASAQVETIFSNAGSVSSNKDTTVRPATTTGARVNTDFVRHQLNLAKDKLEIDKPSTQQVERRVDQCDRSNVNQRKSTEPHNDKNVNDTKELDKDTDSEVSSETKTTEQFVSEGKSKESIQETRNIEDEQENTTKTTVAFVDELELDLDKLRRPRTVATTGTGHAADLNSDSPPISPKQFSRRASRASDFFQEERKVDLVQLRLNAARAVDFTDQVRKFCESVDSTLDSKNRPTSDYYTIRLEASMKARLEFGGSIVDVPGTPDDENRRALGNVHIRSLTLPDINWNFDQ